MPALLLRLPPAWSPQCEPQAWIPCAPFGTSNKTHSILDSGCDLNNRLTASGPRNLLTLAFGLALGRVVGYPATCHSAM